MQVEGIDLLDFANYRESAPHAIFERLRREAPVFWQPEPDDGPGFWSLTKHADIKFASKHPEIFSSTRGTNIFDPAPHIMPIIQGIMINMDPPRHTEYRALINRGFSPRRMGLVEPFVRERAREIVDGVAGREEFDFVEEVAALLPMTTICELFGIPESDRRYCYDLANQLIGADDPDVIGEGSGEQILAEVFQYATRLAALKREQPAEDLATVLVQGELDGKPVDDMVFGTFVVMLIVAGNETTRTVTTNGMLRLIESPEQCTELARDPSLIPNAIEEMLRYEPAVHHFRRTLQRDFEMRGQPMRAGDKVLLWYGSGNRDEEIFPDPHRFDIRRPNARDHLAFGTGEHFCLGANLARLQLRAIFEELLPRLPQLELAAPPRRLRSNFVNGVKEMRVRRATAA